MELNPHIPKPDPPKEEEKEEKKEEAEEKKEDAAEKKEEDKEKVRLYFELNFNRQPHGLAIIFLL